MCAHLVDLNLDGQAGRDPAFASADARRGRRRLTEAAASLKLAQAAPRT